MLRRRTAALSHCLNRAAEAEHLSALSRDIGAKKRYTQLAAAWRHLARNAEFTEKLDAMLSEQDDDYPV
jgi:hypothetical protein